MIEDLNSLSDNERDLEISEIVNDLYYNYGSIRHGRSIMPFTDASGCVVGDTVFFAVTRGIAKGVVVSRHGDALRVRVGGVQYEVDEEFSSVVH